jgi:conjugative relaxase-like TrwC/TraI family protein
MVGVTMLRITKLKGAEYLIRSVAAGMEDYYMGAGEAPGVWRGRWAAELGLEGVVEADALRALVTGLDPNTGVDLLAGHRERKVRAFDVTLSVPKSASLLWALGTPETASVVSIAVVEATEVALAFLEERAAFARQQQGGVRRRVSTHGFAIATFAHRTSRAGDPQLHVHCLIPNIVRRGDGEHVAFDADPLHVWGKAAGTVFLNELERLLTERLGVAWGPERNGCREMVGFTRDQLRAFSKRTVAIETHLEAAGEVVHDSKRARMRADDRASLATRQKKDKSATPEQLRQRWVDEAEAVVDETSQIGTRDAAVVLDAVAAAPGAQVWFVGDARQAQSVAAGGLAAELERLAHHGDIPAAVLEVNRRQRHPAERAALARYRAGDLDASNAIRSDHGWEHELPTPGDTRQALAAAAVKDADRHGAEHVAVVAVSHADCEDLADRIRAIRAARGELRSPTLTGPGWGPDPRVYTAGDRVLVHANLDHGSSRRIHNGSTGTVLTVTSDGLTVALDNGPQVRLDARLVGGFRPDGTPNVSHAWARTVDGAQGGTWRQVHLLGTPALDRFTGYVGQSRGQAPTHTWNTRPEPDHPLSLVADDRTPGEAVLDAMHRAEAKTLAARNDPWTLDRRLRAERDEHAAVAATRPPDPQPHL